MNFKILKQQVVLSFSENIGKKLNQFILYE